jgi:hypothetical protein
VIFSLLAKSRALSNGILSQLVWLVLPLQDNLPNSFQMHRSNLHDVASLLTLQYAVPATTGHAGHVKQLRAVDHVIVYHALLAVVAGSARESLLTRERTDLLFEPRKLLWLLLGSKDFLHPPTALLSLAASYLEEQFGLWYRIGVARGRLVPVDLLRTCKYVVSAGL